MATPSLSTTGATTLSFAKSPPIITVISPRVNVATVPSKGGTVYTQLQGTVFWTHILEWTWDEDKKDGRPLRADEYDGGWNYSTNAQTGGTQSLVGFFRAIAVSSLYAVTYTDLNNVQHNVRIMNSSLDSFKRSQKSAGLYTGKLELREYA